MLRTAARSSGMLRTAAVRACALPAARLAPTALPFARAMALGREEGEDLVVKKMLDKVLSNKLERLRTYDVKFRIPEEKLIDLRTKIAAYMEKHGILPENAHRFEPEEEVSESDRDTDKGREIAYAEIAKYKAAGLLPELSEEEAASTGQ